MDKHLLGEGKLDHHPSPQSVPTIFMAVKFEIQFGKENILKKHI
jgi:hypothetical protein